MEENNPNYHHIICFFGPLLLSTSQIEEEEKISSYLKRLAEETTKATTKKTFKKHYKRSSIPVAVCCMFKRQVLYWSTGILGSVSPNSEVSM